ncbi:MAG: hypothetical protein KDA87_25605, partial [Planctomycetales bacterium]|nr:hypothetical protein [Planctomycetales bacterium]
MMNNVCSQILARPSVPASQRRICRWLSPLFMLTIVCSFSANAFGYGNRDYFVSATSGVNDPARGHHPYASWKTINYAMDHLDPQATSHVVFVEAGRYDSLNDMAAGVTSFQEADSCGIRIPTSNVTIVGYYWDNGVAKIPQRPLTPEEYVSNGPQYWESRFPTIVGVSRSFIDGEIMLNDNYSAGFLGTGHNVKTINLDKAIGTGIYLDQDGEDKHNISLMNLHITNFNQGVEILGGSAHQVENLVLTRFGEPRIVSVDANRDYVADVDEQDNIITGPLRWTGFGCRMIDCTNSNIHDCFLMDAEAEGYNIRGTGMSITDCDGFSYEGFGLPYTAGDADTSTNNPARGMDYAYQITGGSSGNSTYSSIVGCCFMRYSAGAPYSGHGFVIATDKSSGSCEYNVVQDCLSVNSGINFEMKGPGVKKNTFRRCTAHTGTRAFAVLYGADYSTFDRCKSFWVTSGIITSGINSELDGSYVVKGNVFRNCQIHCLSHLIYQIGDNDMHTVEDTKFVNCTLVGQWTGNDNQNGEVAGLQYTSGRRSVFVDVNDASWIQTKFTNCIVANFLDFYSASQSSSLFFATLDHCCVWHNVNFDDTNYATTMSNVTVDSTVWGDPLLQKSDSSGASDDIDLHIQADVASSAYDAGLTQSELGNRLTTWSQNDTHFI